MTESRTNLPYATPELIMLKSDGRPVACSKTGHDETEERLRDLHARGIITNLIPFRAHENESSRTRQDLTTVGNGLIQEYRDCLLNLGIDEDTANQQAKTLRKGFNGSKKSVKVRAVSRFTHVLEHLSEAIRHKNQPILDPTPTDQVEFSPDTNSSIVRQKEAVAIPITGEETVVYRR